MMTEMNNQPPKVGEIYFQGGARYRVTAVKGSVVTLVELLDNGIESTNTIKKVWPHAFNNFIKEPSADFTPNQDGLNDSPNGGHPNKDGCTPICWDDKAGEFVIYYPDGGEKARVKGLQGVDGANFYESWARQKGLDPKDGATFAAFEQAFRGRDGHTVNGENAPTPYQEWKSRQPKDASEEETSYNSFLKSITGPKGSDGYEGRDGKDAYEVWAAGQPEGHRSKTEFLNFIHGKDGRPGESAYEMWLRLYPHADKVTVDDFYRWIASLVPAVEGATYIPDISPIDGRLYFTNTKTGERKPASNDTVKGETGDDGDTFVPSLENGCLIMTSTKTGKRKNLGRVKGEEGKPGLNGHNVEHKYGYHDLEDWTCPVQKIGPHMIASSGDLGVDGDPEAHMRRTLDEINAIREKGKILNAIREKEKDNAIREKEKDNAIREKGIKAIWKKVIEAIREKVIPVAGYYLKNPLKEFFWWCAGADRPLLRMCPGEHSKYMGIGTVIFFTALMAMVSSYFAISYVFEENGHGLAKALFAIFWGLMIFFLDRFITNTMYSDGKVTISWLELRSALPRIIISIFLGIVISAPLELKIFDKEVTTEVEEELRNQLKAERSQMEDEYKAKYNAFASSYKEELSFCEEQHDRFNQLFKDVPDDIRDGGTEKIAVRDTSTGKLYNVEKTKPLSKSDKKKNEQNAENRQRYNDSIKEYQSRISELRQKISSNDQERDDSLKAAIGKLEQKLSIDSASGLQRRLVALHTIAMGDDYTPWDEDKYYSWLFWALASFIVLIMMFCPFFVSDECKKEKKEEEKEEELERTLNKRKFWRRLSWKKTAPRLPAIAAIAAVALMLGFCNDLFFHALPCFLFSAVGMIMMLFILIDVSPVFYKMMLADGQYEQYLQKEKIITQDLIRLNFAKSIAKVNNSEVGKLAPMIFGKPYRKIQQILEEVSKQQSGDSKESLRYGDDYYGDRITKENKEIFDKVLGMKRAIIEAAYQAWYRDMHDAIIGMHKPGGGTPPPPHGDSDNAGAEPFPGHFNGNDERFDQVNAYGRRTGTSPEYQPDEDDPYQSTPEDILNGQGSYSCDDNGNDDNGTTPASPADADEQPQSVSSEEDSTENSADGRSDEPTEEQSAGSATSSTAPSEPDTTTSDAAPSNDDAQYEHVVGEDNNSASPSDEQRPADDDEFEHVVDGNR